MSYLQEIFDRTGLALPTALHDWDEQVASWCMEYAANFPGASLSEINLDLAVYVFDHSLERVALVYALSARQPKARDAGRIRGFPDVNVPAQNAQRGQAFLADKGHFLGHASGGGLDINLFPHRHELNRGWSQEGGLFRRMERHVAKHSGTFFYHRPQYEDETWVPHLLEYGVLVDGVRWWIETFRN